MLEPHLLEILVRIFLEGERVASSGGGERERGRGRVKRRTKGRGVKGVERGRMVV